MKSGGMEDCDSEYAAGDGDETDAADSGAEGLKEFLCELVDQGQVGSGEGR